MTSSMMTAVGFYSICALLLGLVIWGSWHFGTWWPVYVLVGLFVAIFLVLAALSKAFGN